MMTTWVRERFHWMASFVVCAGLLSGCAEVESAEVESADGYTVDAESLGEDAAALVESSDLPPAISEALANPSRSPGALLDRVYSLEHYVRVGQNRRIHVTEKFTLRAFLRFPHRGALLLPGTVVDGSFYDLDVDGYRFQSDLARRGFFTFAMDYEGTGESTYPADGYTVTPAQVTQSSRTVLSALRLLRLIPKVDIIGESNGAGAAAELCADDLRVRSCTLASVLYQQGTPYYDAVFQDPGFVAFLYSGSNGYLDVDESFYFNVVAGMSPEVKAVTLATQPGVYASGTVVGQLTLPWFDPTHARVPGLILQGTADDIATQADNDELAADYGSAPGAGGIAEVVRIAGGGHIPRVEPAPVNDQFKQAVFDFIDP